ncbi:hypothetical protein ACIF8W_22590, partial [Streptomyces sp. NPDC085639]
MSQQGADDWWQKLYEGPDAGAVPDPGDTLDNRFRSAAGVTTEPAPNRGQPLGRAPGDPPAPGLGPAPAQNQVPAHSQAPAQGLGWSPAQGIDPGPPPSQAPDQAPGQGLGPA